MNDAAKDPLASSAGTPEPRIQATADSPSRASEARAHARIERVHATASSRMDAEARPCPISVILADDDRLICDSLGIILGAQPDIAVLGAANDGDGAVELWQRYHPDVALLDIQMPGRDGLSAAREILGFDPAARIVFLTTFSDDDYIVQALQLGARGYLIKQDVASIAPALRAVVGGRSVLEGEILARISTLRKPASAATDGAAASAPRAETPSGVPAPFDRLTDRELEVALLIADGLANKDIARTAYMSEGTVRNHISTILGKLALSNRTQIAIACWRAGIAGATRAESGGSARR